MKRNIILILAIAIFPFALQAQSDKKPKIEFESLVYDMGVVARYTSIVKCTFNFKNVGESDLYIHQIFTTCGCTKAEHNTEPVKPGESDKLTVTFDGRRSGEGRIRKRVNVYSNAEEEMTRLTIVGRILPQQEKKVEIIEVEQ